MKFIVAFLLMSVAVACSDKKTTTPNINVSPYDSPFTNEQIAMNNPYELGFDLEKTGDNQYKIITTMKLFGGSFYVSPHSTRDFKGRFTISMADNQHLTLADDFKETPRSKEEIDLHPFINGPVNWVREDTRYEYMLTVNSQDDFDVGGKFIFTIEPKCTLEQVPFILKYRSGILRIEKWLC